MRKHSRGIRAGPISFWGSESTSSSTPTTPFASRIWTQIHSKFKSRRKRADSWTVGSTDFQSASARRVGKICLWDCWDSGEHHGEASGNHVFLSINVYQGRTQDKEFYFNRSLANFGLWHKIFNLIRLYGEIRTFRRNVRRRRFYVPMIEFWH